MANALYDKGREAFLTGTINWGTGTDGDNIKAILVDTSGASPQYAVDLANDQFLDVINVGSIRSTSGDFTGKTTTGGVADADDVTFPSVTGTEFEAVVIFKDTGDTSTSPLIAYIDVASSGLPMTPDGTDILCSWSSGDARIFKL